MTDQGASKGFAIFIRAFLFISGCFLAFEALSGGGYLRVAFALSGISWVIFSIFNKKL